MKKNYLLNTTYEVAIKNALADATDLLKGREVKTAKYGNGTIVRATKFDVYQGTTDFNLFVEVAFDSKVVEFLFAPEILNRGIIVGDKSLLEDVNTIYETIKEFTAYKVALLKRLAAEEAKRDRERKEQEAKLEAERKAVTKKSSRKSVSENE